MWSASDDDLIALATREMAQLGLCDADQVVGGTVVRQEKAYPVYDEDYAANVHALREELEAHLCSGPSARRSVLVSALRMHSCGAISLPDARYADVLQTCFHKFGWV